MHSITVAIAASMSGALFKMVLTKVKSISVGKIWTVLPKLSPPTATINVPIPLIKFALVPILPFTTFPKVKLELTFPKVKLAVIFGWTLAIIFATF